MIYIAASKVIEELIKMSKEIKQKQKEIMI